MPGESLQDSHSFDIRNYIPASSENVYLPRSNESKKKQTENITIIEPPEPTTTTTTPEIDREERKWYIVAGKPRVFSRTEREHVKTKDEIGRDHN